MAEFKETSIARLATLDQLSETTIPLFVCPVPTKDTLRAWFDAAKIPRFKSNPNAKRGGGPVFYSVSGVEKFFRSRILAGPMN
jgi:hypothetical protein